MGIKLIEISQSETNKLYVLIHICGIWKTNITKQKQTDRHNETTSGYWMGEK